MATRLRETVLNVATVLATVAALGMVTVRLQEHFHAPATANTRPRSIAGWRQFALQGHRTGPEHAPVTIVEFADFQCPFCRAATGSLKVLLARYPEQIAVVPRVPLADTSVCHGGCGVGGVRGSTGGV